MRSSSPASSLHNCVNPVDTTRQNMWVIHLTIPQWFVGVVEAVNKARGFYTVCGQLLQTIIHRSKQVFQSVKNKVLHTIHSPNNNKENLRNTFYYLFRRIKK